ncbi:MAG: methyl-accepting chemotaxis protein [Desulfuromonadales bacterium]|nr:methyl-accepting chemotaxis protein [Desulfuromonadales bacterium]
MIKMKLRGKTLLILLLVAVIPLLLSMIFLSSFSKEQIRESMLQFAEKSSNFVERSTAASQHELTNYLELLSHSSDVVNPLYYASLTQDTEQLQTMMDTVYAQYEMDLLEIHNPQGETIIKVHSESMTTSDATETDHPLLVAARESGEPQAGISSYLGKLMILSTTPVKLQDNVIGYMVGAYLLDNQFAIRIKQMGGVEVAFVGEKGVVGASHPDFKKLNLSQHREEILLGDIPHLPIEHKLAGTSYQLVIAQNLDDALKAQQSLRNLMIVLVFAVIAIVLIVSLLFSRRMTNPLLEVVGNLKEIAQGEADLTRTLTISSTDEVGELADNFNMFVARLREMVQRISSAAADISTATDKIRHTSQDVTSSTANQSEALEDSFQAIQGIDESTIEIGNSISALLEAVEISSSAALELGATIEEIVSQVDRLFSTIEGVSSSITEMSVSSQQVADNLDNLSSSTEVTASSITEMDASIKEVEETAQRTNELSEQANRDAEMGKTAVAETIAGIQAIRTTVEDASRAIEELGEQSGEIETILTVIDDVADQTRLLSLNASIIAAQAGEHGKGFAVVADEIRELAERTAMSTQEIAAIIGRLQGGTNEAVKAMQIGSERVHQEAERSKVAEDALDKLTESSLRSSEQVKSIVRATQEQSRGSRQITEAVNQVANMLQQISSAVKQQSEGIHQLAEAAESMRDISSQVKLSTGEQAKGSHQISASMERVRNMLQQIDGASKEQSERSCQVVEAVSAVRKIAEENTSRASALDKIVENLGEQTEVLDKEIGSFKS